MRDRILDDRCLSLSRCAAVHWTLWLCGIATLLGQFKFTLAADPHERFVRGLLDRGLVQVAEHEALRQLAASSLKPAERVEWTFWLAEAYARHALAVGGADRDALADRAEACLLDLLNAQPPSPQREAIVARVAMLKAQRAGGNTGLAFDATPVPADTTELTAAIAGLRSTLTELDGAARVAGRRTAVELAHGELSIGQVRRLEREVEQQLAASLVTQIERLPMGDERTAAITEADRRLQSLADGWIGELATWEARLLRVRLSRLQGQTDHAVGLVRTALQDQPARWMADRFLAEQVRAQTAGGQVDVALQSLLEHSRAHEGLSDELSAVKVQALLAARKVAGQRQDQSSAEALWGEAQAVAHTLPGAWGAIARRELEREQAAARYGVEVARLVEQARGAYQSGNVEAALKLFQQAAARSVADNQPLAADELDYTRASILSNGQRFSETIAVLNELIARSPYGPHTQDGDLLRAYALGKQYAADSTNERQAQYAAALSAHKTQYAGTSTAAEATWMLANLESSREQWTAALALYLTLLDDAEHGVAAQVQVAAIYERILSLLRSQGQPDDDWEDRAVEDLATLVRRYPSVPEQRTLAQSDVALRLVRMVVEHREHLYTEADKLLAPILQTGEHQRRVAERDGQPLSVAWSVILRTAAQWQMISLAGQGRMDESRQVFHDLSTTDPTALLSLLEGLSSLANVIPPEHRQELARLQLEAAQELRLQQPQLTAAQRNTLDAAIADAYLADGNVLNALAYYERLIEQTPRDRARLRTVAELTLQAGDVENLRRSKTYWQRVEALEPKGSTAWLEARLNAAECAAKLQQPEEARKLLALTRLVYPELGGPELKARFDALSQQLH